MRKSSAVAAVKTRAVNRRMTMSAAVKTEGPGTEGLRIGWRMFGKFSGSNLS
jgi:hypothetical protein